VVAAEEAPRHDAPALARGPRGSGGVAPQQEGLKGRETGVAAGRGECGILTEQLVDGDARVGEDGEDEGDGVLACLREHHAARGVVHEEPRRSSWS